jgi:hypothetical protein
MTNMKKAAIALALLGFGAPALAEDKHQLCSERPGLTTNECVIEAGHVQLETGLADWTLERQAGGRTDTLLIGDTLVRIGVGGDLELRVGWTPFGYVRDREGGAIDRYRRAGDVTIGLKRNLIDAQKHGDIGLSLAVIPFATLPVGRAPVGAGDWSTGLQLPVGYRISKTFKLEFTPIVNAAVDKDGSGRHLQYSGALGGKLDITDAISAQAEIELLRDDDPDEQERGTQKIAGISVGLQPDDRTQFDLGTNIGLDRRAPDIEIAAGVTRYF